MKEHTLSVNSFNKPKVLEGIAAKAALIIRLFKMDKGTIQTVPNMGLGLYSEWRFTDVDELNKLETEMYKQISNYLPELLITQVKLSYDDGILTIELILQDETVVLSYDNNELNLVDILK